MVVECLRQLTMSTSRYYRGETFSLVGESGSGKTTIGRAIIRINPTSKGEIIFNGKKNQWEN